MWKDCPLVILYVCVPERNKHTRSPSFHCLSACSSGDWPLGSLACCVSRPLEIANANSLSYHAQVVFRHLLHHVKIEGGCLLLLKCFGGACSYVRGKKKLLLTNPDISA